MAPISYLLTSAYFILNTTSLLLYPAGRLFFGLEQRAISFAAESVSQLIKAFNVILQMFGRDRESALLSLFLVYTGTKFYHCCSWELFFSYLFLYGKLVFFFLFWMASTRAAGYYTFYVILLMLISHPKFRGHSKITKIRSSD